jgi:hypothetical protein
MHITWHMQLMTAYQQKAAAVADAKSTTGAPASACHGAAGNLQERCIQYQPVLLYIQPSEWLQRILRATGLQDHCRQR